MDFPERERLRMISELNGDLICISAAVRRDRRNLSGRMTNLRARRKSNLNRRFLVVR
jgi:hypothetical protein